MSAPKRRASDLGLDELVCGLPMDRPLRIEKR